MGDFNGDGNFDLAIANTHNDTVTVLPGDGKGNFESEPPISVPGGPDALVTGDFNDDGRLDLATADESSNQVEVLLGNGDGTFQPGVSYDVGTLPKALIVGDFTGDGNLDLATANYLSNNLTVLFGDGHGSFPSESSYPVRNGPGELVTGDFNGDGRVDLAAVSAFSSEVTVLLGQGNGTFQNAGAFATGSYSLALVAGDFTGEGRVDLAVANLSSQDVEVLLGNGDGTFTHSGSPNTTGNNPSAMVSGDFNGDGRLDLAVADRNSNDVTVLLGQGDGTFRSAGTFPVGTRPVALVSGDFNGDGRLDLAVANYSSDDVTVLLGEGDGTFQKAGTYSLPGTPSALVAGVFTGIGDLDLAVAIKFLASSGIGTNGCVTILLGNGDGAFRDGGSFTTGIAPIALVAGDFTGDGHLDLAVADYGSNDVTLLLGDGEGNFPSGVPFNFPYAQGAPRALVAGNFSGDDRLDLAVATIYANSPYSYMTNVSVLIGHGDGTLQLVGSASLGPNNVTSLVAGDLTGTGHLDVVAASSFSYSSFNPTSLVTVLLGDGQGNLQNANSFAVGAQPTALATGDFNGDGRLDLAVADGANSDVTTLLGTGTGAFVPAALAPSPVRSTPLVLSFNGEPDAVVLSQAGQILVRQGLANEPGAFAPPIVLNPDPRLAARDLALVQNTSGESFLAALDAKTSTVTLYTPGPDGAFSSQTLTGLGLPAGFLPADIASADLIGNGLGDLVITAAASDQVFVSLQTSPGAFAPAKPYAVGVNPSAIELVNVSGGKLPDIVVTDQFSGQVSVLVNQGKGAFSQEQRFRAGTGLYDLTTVNGTDAVQALEQTSGAAAGPFESGTGTDLAVINSGADNFTLLHGDGLGGVLNPQPDTTFFTGSAPTAIVAGHFITGDSNLDLAILSAESDTISIYRGNGRGGFTLVSTVGAGNQPTGLAVADVTGPGGGGPDGIPDLLVGNAYGDLLILAGHGDGTFSQYRRADQNVSLAVADSPTPGKKTFFFSDQGSDQLAFKPASAGTAAVAGPTVYQDRRAGINAPRPGDRGDRRGNTVPGGGQQRRQCRAHLHAGPGRLTRPGRQTDLFHGD